MCRTTCDSATSADAAADDANADDNDSVYI